MGKGKKWSKQESNVLLQGLGTSGIQWFQRNTGDSYPEWPNHPGGRSRAAVYAKARVLVGPGGLSRGTYSLQDVCRISGYSMSHFLRARGGLGQKWKKTSPTGSYMISDEQFREMLKWLVSDYWCKKHGLYGCLNCGTETRSHRALGLCCRCYHTYMKRIKRKGLPTATKRLLEFLEGKVTETVLDPLRRGLALDFGWVRTYGT